MLLDLTRALTFILSIVALYWATISAFFVPGSTLEDRFTIAVLRLGLAACICFSSGILFSWPSHAHRQPHKSLTSTLPVQLFFWALAGITILFLCSWYLASYPCRIDVSHDCSL